MPRPKKPTHLKAVQGTIQKCRTNENEPVASELLPVAPDHLSAQQAEKFNALLAITDRMKTASADDVDALAALAVVLIEMEDDTVLLQEVGAYYMPSEESGIIRAHPAVARMTSNRQRAQALLGEFGLTPAARSKVSARGGGDVNPFAALDGRIA